jgi:predicted O-linked N-acetylglucosamine transferase (SPINDLY family)
MDFEKTFELAIQHQQEGRVDNALALYSKLLEVQQQNWRLLFFVGSAQLQQKKFNEAIKFIRKSISINPNAEQSHNNLGLVYLELKQWDKALINFTRALEISPNYVTAHINTAVAYKNLKKWNEALASYEKVIAIKPDSVDARFAIGNILKELRQWDEALVHYDKALAFNPDISAIYINYGNILVEKRKWNEALAKYDKAIAIKPDSAEAHFAIGNILKELRRWDDALVHYDKALAIKPDISAIYINYGNILVEKRKWNEALAKYDKAIAIKPDFYSAHFLRGNLLKKFKRWDQALISYEKALTINPDYNYGLGTIINSKMQICDWMNFDEKVTLLEEKILNKQKVITPFTALSIIDSPKIHKAAAEIFFKDRYAGSDDNYIFSKSRREKIRVGYFSADFFNHATMHLMAEVFEYHDRTNFEFIAFSFSPINDDEWQARARKSFNQFIDCHAKTDDEIVSISRSLEIDIAVDLKGYTTDSRTAIFAQRAAPIQVNYLGYPGTMGSKTFDYIIADEIIIPKKNQQNYVEKIAYLPNCYQPNCQNRAVIKKFTGRKSLGLPDSGIVFASFNNNYKITPSLFGSWMRILNFTHGSVLWLLVTNPIAKVNLLQEAEKYGVNSDRLIFASQLPIGEHLDRIQYSDLMLDTFPYGAHTTCSDALRMCVPVITLLGESFASRVAASLLTEIGLSNLITYSQSSYEEISIDLANNPKKLLAIREKLKESKRSSTLFDSALFAKNLELIYKRMHHAYVSYQTFDNIYIK